LRDYSKSGVFLTVAHKKYLEVFIFDTFCMNSMVETIFTQQPMRAGEFGRYARLQVWRGPWRGVH